MALFDARVDIAVPGLNSVKLPRMVRVRQKMVDDEVKDIAEEISRGVDALTVDGRPLSVAGKKLAVTAGSRGIADYAKLLHAIVSKLKAMGAQPFIFPAMGSHAGGTAEGQRELLERYGVTEATMGVPVRSSMETVEVGTLPNGTRVYCDKLAWESDGIVLFNRVKPHTDFKGDWESGLLKMCAIGVGKHEGATSAHRAGFVRFHEVIPEVGKFFLKNAPVLFGVASVENGYERVMRVSVIPPAEIVERERELLALARKSMARLPFDDIDILAVDELGKNISGSGMDPNVIGRPGMREITFPDAPHIGCIVILGLSEETHGSAVGIGAADITTIRAVAEVDLAQTYINHVTSGAVKGAAIPLAAADDEEAMRVALYSVPFREGGERIVHIRNTLLLEEFEVSENMLPEIRGALTAIGEPRPMAFAEGRLAKV
ncbi:MAG: lactate racemase domain-containing protein [Synergistaceae bacterium]|jgi:hypothetical protein|nr:lactate racemase domain-containing protein [Synergistaceae bacterium]